MTVNDLFLSKLRLYDKKQQVEVGLVRIVRVVTQKQIFTGEKLDIR